MKFYYLKFIDSDKKEWYTLAPVKGTIRLTQDYKEAMCYPELECNYIIRQFPEYEYTKELVSDELADKQIMGVTIKLSNGLDVLLPRPNRHHNALRYAYDNLHIQPVSYIDSGFYLKDGTYLSRSDGIKHCKKYNIPIIPCVAEDLYSEDVWITPQPEDYNNEPPELKLDQHPKLDWCKVINIKDQDNEYKELAYFNTNRTDITEIKEFIRRFNIAKSKK